MSYYLFEPCFTRVGEGHDKGGVESRGKTSACSTLFRFPEAIHSARSRKRRCAGSRKRTPRRKMPPGGVCWGKSRKSAVLCVHCPSIRFDPSRLVPVSISSKSTVCIEGARYSLPSCWARLDATAYVGVDQVRVVCRGETLTYPKKRSGESGICYRHYLREFAKKPQAVRQMAPELMEELGGTVWAVMGAVRGDPWWPGRGPGHGESSRRHRRAFLGGSKRSRPKSAGGQARRSAGIGLCETGVHPERIPVPDALAGFVVEKVRATDFDFLLQGGYHE